MEKGEGSHSPGWSASVFMQTTEDVAKAVANVAAIVHSPRPSIIFSSKDEKNSKLQKIQWHVARVLKGFSSPSEAKKDLYNPEVLTSQKRQWANFQMQYLDHRCIKEPSRLFESMVVVGLHPNSDIEALKYQITERNSDGSRRLRSVLSQNQSRVGPSHEPQVLFVYPPEKKLPLKCKDLLSFCFPGGIEVHTVERTPSMSELNEILLGQEHLKQSDLSFVFRLQVADDSTLYGCCVLVEEIVQRPSELISSILCKEPLCPSLGRHILTAPRCYCILSRLPFFDLHFGVLKSIFTEERLKRLTQGTDIFDLERSLSDKYSDGETISGKTESTMSKCTSNLAENDDQTELSENSKLYHSNEVSSQNAAETCVCSVENSFNEEAVNLWATSRQKNENPLMEVVLPLMRNHQYQSSESSSSFTGSPIGDQSLRSEGDGSEMEETSSSNQEDTNNHDNILEWAKVNNHGSLQIVCEYYQLQCPPRGSTIVFHPLDHLHPLEFHRAGETVLHISGSSIDLRSCNTSLEVSEAHGALLSEEEASALSVWTIANICGSLRLENVLMMFAAALLEKQIVVICSNLGILSAVVLSIIPLIRPYQWQSLLMPVLPNDMLVFLDAPVPYVIGVKNKTVEVQTKLSSSVVVDANRNQVKSPTMPQLPQQKELSASLSPYHAMLVGESFLARKRPVYECTDVQVEAAKGFLAVLRSYLDSLCSNLRSHTITNVQSNDDKVSLLLKESFIDSFPTRDRPFMKHFVDTQLFSVHTDLVLSFYQKD